MPDADRFPADREFAAARHALAAPFFRGCVERFVDAAARGIDFVAMLQRPWSTSERAMIEVACTLWGRPDIASARLAPVVFSMDDENFDRVIQAIRIGEAAPVCDPELQTPAGAALIAALGYAAAGWPVLPLHTPTTEGGCSCGRTDCPKPGKHPRTRHGHEQASTDPARIAAWWHRWPRANIGVRTGELVVVDVDGAAGADSLAALEAAHAPLAATRRVCSARGTHLYFQADGHEIACSAGQLAAGLDVRGRGGYIVAPPSRHVTGHPYAWTATDQLAPLPAWLAALLIAAASGLERAALPRTVVTGADERARRYLQAATDAELADVAHAPLGTRNIALNRAAFRLGQLTGAGLGDHEQLACALLAAALAAGLGEREARATIASGLRAGERNPRPRPAAAGNTRAA